MIEQENVLRGTSHLLLLTEGVNYAIWITKDGHNVLPLLVPAHISEVPNVALPLLGPIIGIPMVRNGDISRHYGGVIEAEEVQIRPGQASMMTGDWVMFLRHGEKAVVRWRLGL